MTKGAWFDMTLKVRMAILFLGFLMLLLCTGALAADNVQFQVTGIDMKNIVTGFIGFETYVADPAGNTITPDISQFSAQLNDDKVSVLFDEDAATGYIFVVDVSKPFVPNERRATDAVKSMLSELIAKMGEHDGATVVWAGAKVESNEMYYTKADASANLVTDYVTKYNLNGNVDKCALYNAIETAVEMIDSGTAGSRFNYYKLIIITDGFNTEGSGSLSTVTSMVESRYPFSMMTICLINSSATSKNAAASTSNRNQLDSLMKNLGGKFFMLDYGGSAPKKMPEQVKEVADYLGSELKNTYHVKVDLHNYPGERDNNKSYTLSLNFAYNTRTLSNIKLPIEGMPTPDPTPTPAGPTPTPEPFAVYGASNSDNVRQLQRILAQNGFYKGQPTGNFDDKTRDGYIALCELLYIAPSKIDGKIVIQKWEWESLLATSPLPTATPEPPFVMEGDQNSDHVREFQQWLANLGYYNGNIDGTFGPATINAYVAFCNMYGRTVNKNNGLVYLSRQEWEMLSSMQDLPTPTPSPTPQPTPVPVFASQGDEGSENVMELQKYLQNYGYYKGNLNGNFHAETVSAYQDLCKALGRTVTKDEKSGLVVILVTEWEVLKKIVPATPAPTVPPTPTPTAIHDPYRDIKLGDVDEPGQVAYVGKVQSRLFNKGYFYENEYTYGTFDQSTATALSVFYQAIGQGGLSDGTRISAKDQEELLFSDVCPSAPSPTPVPMGIKIQRRMVSPVFSIGSFKVPTWLLLLLSVLIFLAIIILLIINFGKNKDDDESSGSNGSSTTARSNTGQSGGEDKQISTGGGKQVKQSPYKKVSLQIMFKGELQQPCPMEKIIRDKLLIGRLAEDDHTHGLHACDVVLNPMDHSASRNHCELFFEGDQLMVRNLQKDPGTFVNNNNVRELAQMGNSSGQTMNPYSQRSADSRAQDEVCRVMSGDEIRVGHHTIVVTY